MTDYLSSTSLVNIISTSVILSIVVGATSLAALTPASIKYRDELQMNVLFSIIFVAMIVVVYYGFFDTNLKFAGTPDTNSETVAAIRKTVGVACSIAVGFFLVSLFILRKDPSKTQGFTTGLTFLSFTMAFAAISVQMLS